MKSSKTHHKAEQGFRQSLGRSVVWILHKECQFLTHMGVSIAFAKKIAVVINLFILVSLLFILFPMWIVFVALICGSLLLAGIDIDLPKPQEPKWRMGSDGYGLYRNDIRIDGGSIDDEE